MLHFDQTLTLIWHDIRATGALPRKWTSISHDRVPATVLEISPLDGVWLSYTTLREVAISMCKGCSTYETLMCERALHTVQLTAKSHIPPYQRSYTGPDIGISHVNIGTSSNGASRRRTTAGSKDRRLYSQRMHQFLRLGCMHKSRHASTNTRMSNA